MEAALALARRVGIRSLTMRGLAEELGVTPMAAYYYVSSKQALMDLVANAVLDRAHMPGPEAGSWEDRMWAFLSQNMRELAKYPGLGEYLETSRSMPAGKRHVEELLGLLREAGFDDASARQAFSAIYAYMYGRVLLQSMLHDSRSGTRRRSTSGKGSTGVRLGDLASEEDAEFGFRALTAGIRSMLR